MTVGYSARNKKEKEGIPKKKIGVGDPKKIGVGDLKKKRSADSPDELGTTPPPGAMFATGPRKASGRYGISPKEGMARLSPQDRGSWDEKSCASRSFQERTPTPESCRHSGPEDLPVQVKAVVRALVSANPPDATSFVPLSAEGFGKEAINGGFPTPGSMNISPELEYPPPPPPPPPPAPAQNKVRTKREDGIDHSDKEVRHQPAPAVKASSSSKAEKGTRESGQSTVVVCDRNIVFTTTPSDRGGSTKASLKLPAHQLPPPGYEPHPAMMPHRDPAELQAWMASQYEMNGCKGGCSRTSAKGKRGKKSSSDASSSREAARVGSDAVLRKKIEGALAKHLESQDDNSVTENGEAKVKQLKKMVDSVMSEICSSPGMGTPRKEKREAREVQKAESSSSLHTPRGMRSYPMPDGMVPHGWPCPPHPVYYGQFCPPPGGMPTPGKQTRPAFKASIPSPSSAFSSKTCGSGVSSSSFDSGSSWGNYFWPYTQWYPPPWASGYWGYYGGMPPGMPSAPPGGERMQPPGV